MPAQIPDSIADWSTTAGSNQPSGSANVGPDLNDNLQAMQVAVRQTYTRGSIASAATCDIGTVDAELITVTGTTGISSLGATLGATGYGVHKLLTFAGALTLTHSASLACISSANITTEAGDSCMVEYSASGWTMLWYSRKSGASLAIGGLVQNGSAAAPLGFVGDPDTGPYSAGTNTYGISTGGTLRLSVSSTAVISTLPLQVPAGSSSVPAISYYENGNTDPGIYFSSTATSIQGESGISKIQVGSLSTIISASTSSGEALIVKLTSGSEFNEPILHLKTDTANDSGYDLMHITTDADGTPNLIWRVRGDGATFADGAYSGSGADYAEAFLFTGQQPQPGDPVALDGDRVRIAVEGDDIIGVVSERACAIGDAKLLEQGGVPVGLVGKLRVNPGRPLHPAWRLLAGDLYLVK